MKSSFFKLIWFCFPLTKVVYAYIAYSNQKEINNSFEIVNLLLLVIGITTCIVSILLSKIIYKKSFYENKIVTSILGNNVNVHESGNMMLIFTLFVMLLGLAESAALFGFVQYFITGNIIVGIILFASCFIAWLFNYPANQENAERPC